MLRSIGILLVTLLLASAGAAATNERTLLVYGDSLSAAYGLRVEQGWVTLLQKRLEEQGYGYRVVNASVSGETTSGGKARLQRALDQHHPAVVILELGANDGLRGLPVAGARAGLDSMIDTIRASGATVLLVGIQIPPNYGAQYAKTFAAMYTDLAQAKRAPLVPFLLEGVALDSALMQGDGLHPNAAGQPRVLENVWPHLQPLLQR
ncbi:MAG: arylesterase [Nevskiaceae bacterium]|jgi:acyl-CoA thioesterase-1|nr:arylesterase [Nevskiaceae bacterium]